jgi:hypothetical protein
VYNSQFSPQPSQRQACFPATILPMDKTNYKGATFNDHMRLTQNCLGGKTIKKTFFESLKTAPLPHCLGPQRINQ